MCRINRSLAISHTSFTDLCINKCPVCSKQFNVVECVTGFLKLVYHKNRHPALQSVYNNLLK